MLPEYAELHCLSNFSFLRGASHPEELATRAHQLGYHALALTDECSVAGVVRAHVAAKTLGLKFIIGAELAVEHGPRLVLLATDRAGYGKLCTLITRTRMRAAKGSYRLERDDLDGNLQGCLALLLPGTQCAREDADFIAERFAGRAWIAVELLCGANDAASLARLRALGRATGLPLVAAGDVHLHVRSRRPLQDVLTAIRLGETVSEAGHALQANAERHLRQRLRLAQVYPAELLAQTLHVAERCSFSLDSLRYEYPAEVVPAGLTPAAHLRALTEQGVQQRFPGDAPAHVRKLIEHELALIAELGYEHFFLTVHDIVHFARSRNILCQGRGSAANSAVCFCLGITEVDPARMSMLFERFISRERNEPPDIDVDFEHQRREEVIQYIYAKYGRDRAALAATVICYRPRSALRDVGKALGMAPAQLERISRSMAWWDGRDGLEARLREQGCDPDSPVIGHLLALTRTLCGFPRHLSQHVGGFVITRGPLAELVPVENAAMPERSVIQWDKDDLDALGMLKVDVLALGMLSTIRRALALISTWRGHTFALCDVPAEDPEVYRMISRADTVGVFQIESRAQMSMLPRLKPDKFYDLVIEVAIVRPGPIQGGMVHPYLRRKQGLEPVTYPGPEVKRVLERTLGVPIFQEQAMELVMVAAGFTPGEADQLRRSMAAWRRKGGLEHFRPRLLGGMKARGYSETFAEQIYQQICGFGDYGFPESHAASFALLAYVSSWLKCHEPAAFLAALLNSQPMGFYSPSVLVQDARRHGVTVLPVDVTVSEWECALEAADSGKPAVRLGLLRVKGLSAAGAQRMVTARAQQPFASVQDLALRAELARDDLGALAAADALSVLAGHRRQAHWLAAAVEKPLPLLRDATVNETRPLFEPPAEGESLIADYASTGLTLGRHPLALLRARLKRMKLVTAADLHALANGRLARTAGIVTCRQRPGTAGGVMFVTLEDETGWINVVVWQQLVQTQRREVLHSRLLGVEGVLQNERGVVHLIAHRLTDHSRLLGQLVTSSRDFH